MDSIADQIALVFIKTPTKERGILFKQIADALRQNSQHFTAKLFDDAAETYGYPRT